jgi:hypothetical protein
MRLTLQLLNSYMPAAVAGALATAAAQQMCYVSNIYRQT